MKKKILIVEDEFYIAQDLAAMLEELNYEVVGIAETVSGALKKLSEHKVDMVLLDIQLNDSFDGVNLGSIIKAEHKVPFIFTTAFSDPATLDRVKNLDPAGYIIKPYDENVIRVSLELGFSKKMMPDERNEAPMFINSVSGMIQVHRDQIRYVQAYDYYANVFTDSGKIMAKMTLKELMEQMNHPMLIRVHRSFAVNINRIDKMRYNEISIGDDKIPVGRSFREELNKHIKVL